MLYKRYIKQQVSSDLTKKMVFVGGPRQVGKTTFALGLNKDHLYLNWDIDEDRARILDRNFNNSKLIIFDEIHKYKKWRGYLKGLFDRLKATASQTQVLVTGSARLDYYRYGGESLQGRYHYIRLLPLTLKELHGQYKKKDALAKLFQLGGFPEPFAGQSEIESRRWQRDYCARLVREDLRDLETVTDLGTIEVLSQRLPDLVGNPLSINGLREDLRVSFATVSNWIDILERLYFVYRIPPFGSSQIKAVKKEQKLYMYNWATVEGDGPRFENMVAGHLLKYVYWLQDSQGRNVELRFFRDRERREVDFVVVEKNKILMMVECKLADSEIAPDLKYLKKKFPTAPAYQVLYSPPKLTKNIDGIEVCSAETFFNLLV